MIHNSKEEHDLYVSQMISNLAHDEAAFNLDARNPFADNHHAYAILLEELDESIEALEMLKGNVEGLWKLVKRDYDQKEIIKQLQRIETDCKFTIQEVVQVYAVAIKAIEQLGGNNG